MKCEITWIYNSIQCIVNNNSRSHLESISNAYKSNALLSIGCNAKYYAFIHTTNHAYDYKHEYICIDKDIISTLIDKKVVISGFDKP